PTSICTDFGDTPLSAVLSHVICRDPSTHKERCCINLSYLVRYLGDRRHISRLLKFDVFDLENRLHSLEAQTQSEATTMVESESRVSGLPPFARHITTHDSNGL